MSSIWSESENRKETKQQRIKRFAFGTESLWLWFFLSLLFSNKRGEFRQILGGCVLLLRYKIE